MGNVLAAGTVDERHEYEALTSDVTSTNKSRSLSLGAFGHGEDVEKP